MSDDIEETGEVISLDLPTEQLLAQLPRDRALLELVLGALARRLSLAEGLLGDITLLPVARRIPRVLDRLDDCLGGERPRLTREHLGALVGARRETVSRVAGALGVG